MSVLEEDLFVEQLLDKRIGSDGKVVKWKDCEVEANTKEHIQCNTWEVEEHIQSKGLISKFKRENTKMSRK